jgi:hypothetical protein
MLFPFDISQGVRRCPPPAFIIFMNYVGVFKNLLSFKLTLTRDLLQTPFL